MSTDAELVAEMKKMVGLFSNSRQRSDFERLVSLAEAALPQKFQCYWSRRALGAERAAQERKSKLMSSSRPTIMDGEVVTLAIGFEPSTTGRHQLPAPYGPFEVSASRNAVVVHRADLRNDDDVDMLIAAVMRANEIRKEKR